MDDSLISDFQKLEQTFEEHKQKLIEIQKNNFNMYYYITKEEYIHFPIISIYYNFIGYSYSLEEIERLENVIKSSGLKYYRIKITYFPIKKGDIFPIEVIRLKHYEPISLQNNKIKILITNTILFIAIPELINLCKLFNSKQKEWFGKVQLMSFVIKWMDMDVYKFLHYVPDYAQAYSIKKYTQIGLYNNYYNVAIVILNQNNRVVYSGAKLDFNFKQIIEDLLNHKEPVIEHSYHFKDNTIFNDKYKKIISMFKELTLHLYTLDPKRTTKARITNNFRIDNQYNLYDLSNKPYIEIIGSTEDDESLNTPIEYLAKKYSIKFECPIDIKIDIQCHYMKQADLLSIENLKCSLCLVNTISEKEDYIVCYLCLTQHKQFYLCNNCIHYIIEENLYSIHEHPLLLIPSGGRKYITKMKTFLPVHIYDSAHLYKPLNFDEPKDEDKYCEKCGTLIKYNYWKSCYNDYILCKWCFIKYKTEKDSSEGYYPFLRVRQGWMFATYKAFYKTVQ